MSNVNGYILNKIKNKNTYKNFCFFMLKSLSTCLTFDTASADALHDVFPEEYKHKEERERNDCNSRHLNGIVNVARRFRERVAQAVCYHLVGFVVCDESRPDI